MSRTAAFVVDLPASCPPDEALRRVLDLRAHSRLIPLTTVTPAVAADDLVTGLTFVGRTAVGRVGFDDPMRILSLSFDPPAARIVKEGRVIAGAINITVTPAAIGSRVRWEQTVEIPWLPRSLQPVAARILREGYRRMLSKLLDGG